MGKGHVDVDAVGRVALEHQTHEVPDFLWTVAETPLLPEFSVTPPPEGGGLRSAPETAVQGGSWSNGRL